MHVKSYLPWNIYVFFNKIFISQHFENLIFRSYLFELHKYTEFWISAFLYIIFEQKYKNFCKHLQITFAIKHLWILCIHILRLFVREIVISRHFIYCSFFEYIFETLFVKNLDIRIFRKFNSWKLIFET